MEKMEQAYKNEMTDKRVEAFEEAGGDACLSQKGNTLGERLYL